MYYLAYALTLFILLIILGLLWQEERRFKSNITHGLASKYWILRERRKFVRFNEEIKIRYNPMRSSVSPHYSKTANISRKGLCLLVYEKLKKRDSLEMEMELPGFSKPVKLTGQILWVTDLRRQDAQGRRLFYTGIRFTKIRPESEAILLTHLNMLKGI